MDPTLVYNTATLIAVVQQLLMPSSFLLDKFFPNIVESDTEYVAIDVEIGKRRMAPFVSPLVPGKMVEGRRMQTNLFKPAYIKDKRAIDPNRQVKRVLGERLGGVLSPVERELANLNFELEDQVQSLTRRNEWMAAQGLQTGQVVISGEGFETVVVDFGRHPDLTEALSGTDVWGHASRLDANGLDTKVVSDINGWCVTMLRISGATVTDIVFTPTAWDKFIIGRDNNGAVIMPKLNEGSGNAINPAAAPIQGATYQGRWGQKDLWIYNDWYVDPEDDVEYPMLEDGNIILASSQVAGTRGFGCIQDPDLAYPSMAFAPKSWTEKDPARRLLMTQSSPIIIPSRPNASMCITVV